MNLMEREWLQLLLLPITELALFCLPDMLLLNFAKNKKS